MVKIEANLPEGFTLDIEETEQLQEKALIACRNNEGKKLYLKLLPLEMIQKGFSFEILSP